MRRRVAQCNNVYIFPAMDLDLVASGAQRVTDGMFTAAALGEQAPVHHDPAGALPEIADMPSAATTIAEAVAVQAVADGVAPQRSTRCARPSGTAAKLDSEFPLRLQHRRKGPWSVGTETARRRRRRGRRTDARRRPDRDVVRARCLPRSTSPTHLRTWADGSSWSAPASGGWPGSIPSRS
jgi:Malic enzyme, NAD binding domain